MDEVGANTGNKCIMVSVQENPKLSKCEKIVNAAGKAVIACLLPIAWVIRKIWPPSWKKKHED